TTWLGCTSTRVSGPLAAASAVGGLVTVRTATGSTTLASLVSSVTRYRVGERSDSARVGSCGQNGRMQLPVMPPVAPMLAKSVPTIPAGASYEPKWDGFRSIVFRDGDEVEFGSRNERPMTRYFPELVAAVRDELPPRCVVDGEIVIATDAGLDFEA